MMGVTEVTVELVERTVARPGVWLNIADLIVELGTDTETMRAAVEALIDGDGTPWAAEPEPFGHRVRPLDRELAPELGGEQRHKIAYQG